MYVSIVPRAEYYMVFNRATLMKCIPDFIRIEDF